MTYVFEAPKLTNPPKKYGKIGLFLNKCHHFLLLGSDPQKYKETYRDYELNKNDENNRTQVYQRNANRIMQAF